MDLGDRMKQYERAYDIYMPSRVPVIVRLDGKGFSKFTKKIKSEKPFDEFFSKAMSFTTKSIAEKVEGCLFGYTQSDEMTFVLRNDQSLESVPWFGNRVQKIASIMSSMAGAYFNQYMLSRDSDDGSDPLAFFDARVFIVPDINEAINCLVWRQNDAVKNSVSAACYYEVARKTGKKTARKLMHGLNQKQQQELLFQQTGMNWNDYHPRYKRGIGAYRIKYEKEVDGNVCLRTMWKEDDELPIFARDRTLIEDILSIEE